MSEPTALRGEATLDELLQSYLDKGVHNQGHSLKLDEQVIVSNWIRPAKESSMC